MSQTSKRHRKQSLLWNKVGVRHGDRSFIVRHIQCTYTLYGFQHVALVVVAMLSCVSMAIELVHTRHVLLKHQIVYQLPVPHNNQTYIF